MKRINLPWTDARDVHYPIDDPNPTHVQNLGQRKTHLDFFKLVRRFGTKNVPPRRPHEISECSGPTLV